jgi:L-ascorbate metabolism protein UlaG (beta-lactamase superfamily)
VISLSEGMLTLGLSLFVVTLVCAQAQVPSPGVGARQPQAGASAGVTLRWYGQAFFSLTGSDGPTVVIDPFKEMGYPLPKELRADVVLVTHGHFDHANTDIIQGSPTVLKAEEAVGSHTVKGTTFVGTATFHDEEGGAKRGRNTVFSFELAGVHFCHMGDIGHLLTEGERQSIGPVDILMVPVGGYYTIPVEKVDSLIGQLNPKVVIPMHYKTEAVPGLPIAPVSTWLQGKKVVKRLGSSSVTLQLADLPKSQEVWVLEAPAGAAK